MKRLRRLLTLAATSAMLAATLAVGNAAAYPGNERHIYQCTEGFTYKYIGVVDGWTVTDRYWVTATCQRSYVSRAYCIKRHMPSGSWSRFCKPQPTHVLWKP